MANTSQDEAYYNKHQDEDLDIAVAQAVEAAAKGESIEQLLELMMSAVTGPRKDLLRKKFAAALKKRGLKEPRGDADVPSRNVLARLRDALAISAKQAFDRVAALMRSRPDLAARVQEAGRVLAQNGVTVDKIQISEAELGTIIPNSMGKSQARGDTGRNV